MISSLHKTAASWIESGSRVLDLGTGDGEFLSYLVDTKKVRGEGVELDAKEVAKCVQRGLVVHQGDIMDGLDQYGRQSVDYVLMMGTFQELYDPDDALEEAFRVGKNVVISYTNFAHWSVRFQVMIKGRSPITKSLPFPWYESPNAKYFSVNDFDEFCRLKKYKMVNQAWFARNHKISHWPNFWAEEALAFLNKEY